MIEVKEAALQKAASEGMDEFIQVFTDKYKEIIGDEFTAESMQKLTGEQHSLLAYQLFREEIMFGGFCQLIQNGYGGYIFDNPFARVMRLWGIAGLSKLIYKAKKIYDAHRDRKRVVSGKGVSRRAEPCVGPDASNNNSYENRALTLCLSDKQHDTY